MQATQYLRLTVISVAMLGAGLALAEEMPLPTEPAQQRENIRGMSTDDRTAYREQMQERMRNMTPEEQKLMRETSANGRARMENRQSAQGDGMRGGGREGGRYGQGYESRQGNGTGGGGGRGMGGGRHR